MNSHRPNATESIAPALPQWSRSSSAWSEHAEQIAVMTRDASDALLRSLAAREGEQVLDVACGPGDPSLRLGQSIAPRGRVVSIDAIDTMIGRTAQRARDGDLRIAPVQSRGEQLPFASGSFDAVCCRFGIMFFEAPLNALVEARRVLRPHGRAAYAVWGPRERNVYFTATADVLDALDCPALEAQPDAPTPFQFCEPDALASLMREAGFADVREQTQPIHMRFPGLGPRDLLDVQRNISPSIGERVAGLDAAALDAVRDGVAKLVRPWFVDGRLELPGEILVISGVVGS
jgi:ubiquinone/menaquinone biosynthesis C-methylase UbiE